MPDCRTHKIRYFGKHCPKCGDGRETASQFVARMAREGIAPIKTSPSDGDMEFPIRLDTPEKMARHSLCEPAMMVAVSQWTSGAPAGTHDGVRDGAQSARCARRVRIYYPLKES